MTLQGKESHNLSAMAKNFLSSAMTIVVDFNELSN